MSNDLSFVFFFLCFAYCLLFDCLSRWIFFIFIFEARLVSGFCCALCQSLQINLTAACVILCHHKAFGHNEVRHDRLKTYATTLLLA